MDSNGAMGRSAVGSGVRVFQARDPSVVDYIKPWIIGDPESQNLQIYEMVLRKTLELDPENCCVLLAIDQKDQIQGFVWAYAPEAHNHVWINEVHVEPKYPQASPLLLDRLIEWTRLKGRSLLRGQTQRNEAAILRKWGFERVAVVVQRGVEYEHGLPVLRDSDPILRRRLF